MKNDPTADRTIAQSLDEGPNAHAPAVLELHVDGIQQLYNSMDPAPFRSRELDPKAHAYIVDWAREVGLRRTLQLRVDVDQQQTSPEDTAILQEAIGQHFAQRAALAWRQLKKLFSRGRISLLIGLSFLGLAILAGDYIASLVSRESYAGLVSESLKIGGWVALWRPLEIFLYDWWPIHAEAKLYERLSAMEISVEDFNLPKDVKTT